MEYKNLLQKLGFTPKENTSGVYQKKYIDCNNYAIEVDYDNENIDYGTKITTENRTTLNFSQAENWVVLECVNRLLEKGYQPGNITLEKTYPSGHGTSGRLDILVTHEDDSAYLMIECKTWGAEFDKEFNKLEKNGGQLFTYFQQDKNADVLMLYASELDGNEVKYRNEIIKIEEDYRQTGNVKDFYERWNKLPKSNGIFDSWTAPYEYQSKALTKKDLKVLKQEDSSFIFNRFLEILRHNVVSDKPNAFNKIFTLFLCKIIDEDRNDDEQLHFQWIEGEDGHISFQKRLTDLYNRGMLELLEKKVTDVSDAEFDKRFQQVDDKYREQFKEILTEIRLKKNNEFAIKEVYDDESFNENAKVVKEVVELLQDYQLRYNYRQQFLSDFFELLLTTGLKQESGQFFTPVPIARFIIKSLPLQEIAEQKMQQGNKNDLLPLIIDYAAGSGHFITESMEEVQKYIDNLDETKLIPTTKRAIKKWKNDQFDWAEDYVYGIEKDYRLVKTAKVSCYLHGDGLAKIIHGDGLGDFSSSTEFKDLLKETDHNYTQDNKQFDVIISNPPYSVSAFKGSMITEEKADKAFDLYARLTDQSSEIECLFIERSKQLLKDGGVAGIILPSSILSNTGIYTQAREIILKYFEILAVTELGSSTFMATGTNTVTLFLKRRNNADAGNIEEAVKKVFTNLQDITINGIENPVQKYITHVWEGITFEDYISLLKKQANENIQNHEIYQDYQKKIKANNEQQKQYAIITLEQEKLLYFILAYPQKLVLVKTGQKKEEKHFLGYEFSNRRGSEGIHPIQRGKTIDDCTQLYDSDTFENPEKASTYILKAYKGEFNAEIPENLQKNISYQNLVDMLTFDRVDFEKNISISAKKVKYEEIWNTSDLNLLGEISVIKKGKTITEAKTVKGNIPVIAGGQSPAYYHNESNRKGNVITISASGAYSGFVNYFETPIFASDCNTVISKDEKRISTKLIYYFLNSIQTEIYDLQRGQAQPHVYGEDLANIKIPLPPKDIQEKIVAEIELLEEKEQKTVEEVKRQNIVIKNTIDNYFSLSENIKKLGEISDFKRGPFGGSLKKEIFVSEGYQVYEQQHAIKNDFSIGRYYINEEKFQEMKGFELFPGDLIMSCSGTIGKIAVFPKNAKKGIINQALLRFRPKKEITTTDYMRICLSHITNKFIENSHGASLQNVASVSVLKEINVYCPSLTEQQKIVSEIEQIETKINLLEKKLTDIPGQKEAVLKRYL